MKLAMLGTNRTLPLPFVLTVIGLGTFITALDQTVGLNRIQKFTSAGVFVSKWGTEGQGDGQFISAEGVAMAPDGSVYVADSGNHRIQKFSVGP